jgi:hypothetical protein
MITATLMAQCIGIAAADTVPNFARLKNSPYSALSHGTIVKIKRALSEVWNVNDIQE